MIQHLHLENLVLVDTCDIEFPSHFTALTGETGAGKTALIEAIHLALGARADTALIRNGMDKGCVEVSFDIACLPMTLERLEEAGIACDPKEPLIIRRELSREGKNRALINCQMVPLPVLQKIGETLLELIGQHSHQTLVSPESQRDALDRFGDCLPHLSAFQAAWKKENTLKKQLDTLLAQEAKREREEEILRLQLTEIEEAKLKEGEEELITQEHKRLFHAQEIGEKVTALLTILSTAIPQTNKTSKLCSSLLSLDPKLSETHSFLDQASINLNEAQHELQSYLDKLDSNPAKFAQLEDRLALIHRLKRKYGADILPFYQDLRAQLNTLENLSEEIEKKQLELAKATAETDRLATQLTTSRKQSGKKLQEQLTTQLHTLNMPSAQVLIRIASQPRCQYGDDGIEFWMRANTGEQEVPIKDHASGGELSRLLFALKICLAEKNNTPTLIFDEIDANVGGKTAGIIGEKLRALGELRQVICITHFPQVASFANAHISVQKMEKQGRTITTIRPLNPQEWELELARMLGGSLSITKEHGVKPVKPISQILGSLSLLALCSSFQLITDYGFIDPKHPVHFDGEYRNVRKAKFRTHGVEGSHVKYADAHAFAYYSHQLTPDNSLCWELGYSFLEFDWNKNPRFQHDDYHFANASVGWVSTSLEGWRWIFSGAVSVDTHSFNFGQTGVYYGLMWGRYQLSPSIGMHIGAAGYVGVQNSYILPIMGIDWRASKHWQINGIFPVLVSIEYLYNDNWSTSLEWATFGRPYRFPIRVQDGIGRFKNGIFEVYSKGIELDMKYKCGNAFTAAIGAGWNFGGWILIKDRHSNHGRYYKYNDAPYAQGRLMFTF